MPRFIIERNFAEQFELTRDGATAVKQVNADVGVQWLFSFLSADKKKTYCLYEAPNAEAIREAARRLNIPADVIIEVDSELRPELFACEQYAEVSLRVIHSAGAKRGGRNLMLLDSGSRPAALPGMTS